MSTYVNAFIAAGKNSGAPGHLITELEAQMRKFLKDSEWWSPELYKIRALDFKSDLMGEVGAADPDRTTPWFQAMYDVFMTTNIL